MLHGPQTNKSLRIVKDQPLCKNKLSSDPQYRWQDNSAENHIYRTKGGPIITVDKMVVPYEKFLLMKYKCHSNVELYINSTYQIYV